MVDFNWILISVIPSEKGKIVTSTIIVYILIYITRIWVMMIFHTMRDLTELLS